jgi:hypothetical protein
MRARIFYDTNSPGLCGAVEAWMKKWRPVIKVYSEQLGCGCHHDLHEIDAPAEALAELPEEVLMKGEP